MQLDLTNLPSDPALLQRLVRDIAAAIDHRDTEIERLKSIIKQLQRMQFGRNSDASIPTSLHSVWRISTATFAASKKRNRRSHRKPPLRRDAVRSPIICHAKTFCSRVCSCCGGALHLIGESVSDMLDWGPAQLRVLRTTRPKYAFRACNKVVQAGAPERSIAGGLAAPALLAHVLISKYCDHLPLYR